MNFSPHLASPEGEGQLLCFVKDWRCRLLRILIFCRQSDIQDYLSLPFGGGQVGAVVDMLSNNSDTARKGSAPALPFPQSIASLILHCCVYIFLCAAPQMQSFYNLVLVNSCAKFTKTCDFVRNWPFFVNYILVFLSEKRLLCKRKQCLQWHNNAFRGITQKHY